jgi:hypothetical protein
MRYVLMIYSNEGDWERASQDDIAEMYRGHEKLGAELRAAGKMIGGEQLQPSSTATLVRQRNGNTLTSDGPFIETKEQLGGFYLIEADSQDEAIQWAAKIPSSGSTTIEVRPIVES